MRVKCFVEGAQLLVGSSRMSGDLSQIEAQINQFLDENPGVQIVDIKLSSHAAPVGDKTTLFFAVAIVLYKAIA